MRRSAGRGEGPRLATGDGELSGKRVVILVEDGYEDLEFWYPYYRLKEAGAEVQVGAHAVRQYESTHGYPAVPDVEAKDLDPGEWDAVVIPGGTKCPDRMRMHREILDFVRGMFREGKVVAAICHAAWVPISAGVVEGRRMTCWPSVKDDLVNAGGRYEDVEAVVDGNLVSSRKPDDLPAFARAIMGALQGAAGPGEVRLREVERRARRARER